MHEPKIVQQTGDSLDNWRDSQNKLRDSRYQRRGAGVHKMDFDDEHSSSLDIDGFDVVKNTFASSPTSNLEHGGGQKTQTLGPGFEESPDRREETMLQRDNQLERIEATSLREDANSKSSSPCLEVSQECFSPHSTSEESHAERQEPEMKVYHRLSLHYPMFAMNRLKHSYEAMVSILEKLSVLDSVDVLAGYDILPNEASFLDSDAGDFFTGLCYSDCYG